MIFDTYYLLLAILIGLLWLPQTAMHELSHAAVIKYLGGKIISLTLYPTYTDNELTLAKVTFNWPEKRPSNFANAIASSAPQILNTLVLIIISILYITLAMPKLVTTFLAAVALANFIDGSVNLSTFYRSEPRLITDGWSTQQALGIEPIYFRLLAILWQLGFGLMLLVPWS